MISTYVILAYFIGPGVVVLLVAGAAVGWAIQDWWRKRKASR
jgi:hypothetical protein